MPLLLPHVLWGRSQVSQIFAYVVSSVAGLKSYGMWIYISWVEILGNISWVEILGNVDLN